MNSSEIKKELSQIKARNEAFDNRCIKLMITWLIGGLLVAIAYSYFFIDAPIVEKGEPLKVFMLKYIFPYLRVVIGYGVFFIVFGRLFDKWAKSKQEPEYLVIDDGEVIKVFGSVPSVLDIKKAFLDGKPDFDFIDDAYKKYGCTLAAERILN